MNARLHLAFFLSKCSRLLTAAIPILLPPKALIELNRIHFSENVGDWQLQADTELSAEEAGLFEQLGIRSGSALCFGCGTGREVFTLAKRGLKTVGIDQVPESIRFANDHARKNHLSAEFLEGEINQFEIGGRKFDYAFMLNVVYSYLPSREYRIEVLRKIRRVLIPNGLCILNFVTQKPNLLEIRWYPYLRVVARLFGSHYEPGDRVLGGNNFIHFFHGPEAVLLEGREAGFSKASHITLGESSFAVFTKDPE